MLLYNVAASEKHLLQNTVENFSHNTCTIYTSGYISIFLTILEAPTKTSIDTADKQVLHRLLRTTSIKHTINTRCALHKLLRHSNLFSRLRPLQTKEKKDSNCALSCQLLYFFSQLQTLLPILYHNNYSHKFRRSIPKHIQLCGPCFFAFQTQICSKQHF